MAVHGTVPQPGRAGGSGAGVAEAYNARSAELKALDKGTLCRPGLVQAWQYVQHDHAPTSLPEI